RFFKPHRHRGFHIEHRAALYLFTRILILLSIDPKPAGRRLFLPDASGTGAEVLATQRSCYEMMQPV
ncbi:MAG TPA: hypothetical protein PKL37_17290, partial [Panacibacter sp.]|nr:hypothetical protein [Panacibacter sp.]